MAMQKWTLSLTVYGLSNSHFFVPFIAKTAMQKYMLAFTVCGSSNSSFFVAFITKNGDAEVDVGFNSCVVCPIATSLSLSLPRMGMQKWTLAFTVCGFSNSHFFVPFNDKNGDAEVDVGFYSVCSPNCRFFVPFIAKNDNAEVDVGFYSLRFDH
ncbi:hypothetical protein K7X08_005245 [Anisodus acutangulus]|uniref:Uncharacterized protein n=1 Tax=Anisodus acutangulus TaxID=402998 RepID=A0A9Q1RIY3_9SOLA|nr:hypothetical protein K7X08_005245 [Anisodus acutangulus]